MYLSFQKRGFRGKRGDVGYPLRHLSSIVFAVMIIIILFLIGSKYGEFSGYEKTYFAKDIAYSIDAIYAANGNIIINYPNGLDRYAYKINDSKVIVYDSMNDLTGDKKSQYFVNGTTTAYLVDIGEENYISNFNERAGIFVGSSEEFVPVEYACDSDYERKDADKAVLYYHSSDDKLKEVLAKFSAILDTNYANKKTFSSRETVEDISLIDKKSNLFLEITANYDSNYYTVIKYDIDSNYSKIIACNMANNLGSNKLFGNVILLGKKMDNLESKNAEEVWVDFRIKNEDSAVNQFQSESTNLIVAVGGEMSVVYRDD